jgi:Icc protein
MAGYLVAQITDLHVTAVGALATGGVETAGFTAAAVAHLNELRPPPEVVLITGDLVDGGRLDQYAHLRALLAPLRAPLFLLPGNHDDRDHLRRSFEDHPELGSHGYVQYVIEGPVRVACVDTSRRGQAGGRLDHAQLAWLDTTLAAAPVTPTIVALHHPPFATGIVHMDAMGLDPADAAALGAVVERHPQVERVQAGHLHRTIVRRWRGTVAATAPSVAHAVALDLAGGAAAWNLEPPGVTLHWWQPTLGLVTHVQAIGTYPATPYPTGP